MAARIRDSLTRCRGLVARHPWVWLAWLALTVLAAWLHAWPALGIFLTAAVGVLAWAGVWPGSWQRRVSGPLWRRAKLREVREGWPAAAVACGLAEEPKKHQTVTPALVRLGWRRGTLVVRPGLLVGQTVDDYTAAGERLRTAWGGTRLRVVPNTSGTGCELRCRFDEPLATIFETSIPEQQTAGPTGGAGPVVLGRTEDGEEWSMDVRVPTLCAGSSGAGKGSVMWSLILGLAPAVRAGLVELHGIDLKGGAELGLGRGLFTCYADNLPAAVVLLEDAVTGCEDRARAMAGVTRTHTPTTAEPLIVVVIDELASLVGYVTDRDLLRRAETALSRLLSIGRAPGFVVWGFVQDPRKETIKSRHLFTQSVGLRLRDRDEVAMILGDGALRAGAECHKIPRATPGVGYALDHTGQLARVRAGYVPDIAITTTASRFPAARQVPVVVPELASKSGRRREAA